MSTLVHHLALVSETRRISASQLTRVAAALQKQVVRDFATLWDVSATINAFVRLTDVPVGYWPIVVRDDIATPGAAGVHEDKDGQPFALVQHSNSWPLTASHETLEMLADPFGNRLMPGRSPKKGQGRVEFLVEVCDSCEDAANSYTVNGVMVSDFYTPNFFDPVTNPAKLYSFTGAIKKPRQVLANGYLSWHEPVKDHWWQLLVGPDGKEQYRDLGVLAQRTASLRATIDAMTPNDQSLKGLPAKHAQLVHANTVSQEIDDSTGGKAAAWKEQIKALKAMARKRA